MSYNTGHLVVIGTTAVRVRLQSRKARPVAYSPVHGLEDRFQNTVFLEESKQWISNASIHVVFVWQSRKVGKDSGLLRRRALGQAAALSPIEKKNYMLNS
jgi:hypothetical protein